MTDEQPKTHPVQGQKSYRANCRINELVSLRAYEVYCQLFGAQPAMITGGCRGGFSSGELIAFLYAHSFPKEEWRMRFSEAISGMEHL